MQWRLIDENALKLRTWDGEFVVYNILSGDLHIVDEQAAHILQSLQRAPSDVLSLAQRLANQWQCEPNDELLREIKMTLSEMQALALVESV